MQQRVVRFRLLQIYSTCFGFPQHPSSGILKIVTAASSTGHNIGTDTSTERRQFRPTHVLHYRAPNVQGC